MAESYLEPAGDHILVIDSIGDTTIGEIALPDNMKQQDMVYGTVIEVGPKVDPKYTSAKDTVCYGPYAGKRVVLNGMEFRSIREEHIEAYIRRRARKEESNGTEATVIA
jgi:co-chaperonin GroES (HSP10)